MTGEPPSGRQVEIRFGSQRAVLVEVGAAIREYTVGQRAVIDGFGVDDMPDGGRGQPLLPWPNRLADGQYTFDGQQLQLPIDELRRRNASHGLTRWLNWTVAQHDEARAVFELVLHPRPGYPFTLGLQLRYELSEAGLRCLTTATNLGARALPFGAGFHPYVTAGTDTVDQALLQVPAHEWLVADERMLPTGERVGVGGSEFDFGSARQIGAQRLDVCFSEIARDADGVARVLLWGASGEPSVTLWMDASFRYVQVFTGDTLAEHRRRRGLAVEPMTCPPNAFGSGIDVVRLEPGQQFEGAWGLTPSPLTDP